jgi:glycosyltransferase involved in cell wall biosynthesis
VVESIPEVSVIIATYNMGQYLPLAVRSVLGQTRANLELHVVDDGSTDDTAEAMQEFAGDPRVHYHWQPNAGQTKAKNLGIARARGAFIAFCDADDLWTADKLAVQMPLFDRSAKVGVVYARKRQIRPDGSLGQPAPAAAAFEGVVTNDLFRCNFVPFGTAIIRRQCLDEFGAFDEQYRMGIDWELWLRLSTRYEFAFADQVTYLYRVWPGQMSRNWRGRYEHEFRIMRDFLRKHPGLIPAAVVREAYAFTYARRGHMRTLVDRQYLQGFKDACRSVFYLPTYAPAWRMLGRNTLRGIHAATRRSPAHGARQSIR